MPTRTIDRDTVLHVASLSALSLTDAEADRFAAELARIVAYVELLEQLDTSDVPPTAHVRLDHTPWRDDEPRACLTHADALAQAPRPEHGGFAVPTFVE